MHPALSLVAVALLSVHASNISLSPLSDYGNQTENACLDSLETEHSLSASKVSGVRNSSISSSAPLQKMGSSAFAKAGVITPAEVLRNFSGVSVKDYGGIGGLKTVSIRNFGAQHTGISYDGITISDAQNGQVDIGRFNLENLQSLSLEISGSDDIFRSARLCSYVGVLTMTSAKPAFQDSCSTSASAAMRIASFATYNPYINISQRIGSKWSASIWADYLNSRGDYPFVLHNGNMTTQEKRLGSEVSTLKGEINIFGDLENNQRPALAGNLHIKMAFNGSDRGLPGSVILYTQNPTERLRGATALASVTYTTSHIKAGVNYSGDWTQYTDKDIAYPQPVDDRYVQHQTTIWAAGLWKPLHCLDIALAQDIVISTLNSNLAHCFQPVREGSYTALSTKYHSDRLAVTASVLATVVAEQAREASKGNDSPAPTRWHISPSVSTNYALTTITDLRLRASFKESYRLPTFNDSYYPRIGNKNLKPETAYQSNLGLAWQHIFKAHYISVTADGYCNYVKDKITAVPSMFIWSMRNVGKVLMSGADINAQYKVTALEWLSIKASATYSYQWAVDITDPQAKNYKHQIAYTPRNCGSAQVILSTPWIDLGYTMSAVGQRWSLSQNSDAYRMAPYADHNLSISGQWAFGAKHRYLLSAGAQALNLANTNYEIIQYYPMAGRSFRINIKITY